MASSSSGVSPGKEKSPPCRVCGGEASGFHYGVDSCEGCKGFFRRCITQGLSNQCANEERCEMTPFSRNSCQFCRLKKCISVGMSREGSRLGRRPKRLKVSRVHGLHGPESLGGGRGPGPCESAPSSSPVQSGVTSVQPSVTPDTELNAIIRMLQFSNKTSPVLAPGECYRTSPVLLSSERFRTSPVLPSSERFRSSPVLPSSEHCGSKYAPQEWGVGSRGTNHPDAEREGGKGGDRCRARGQTEAPQPWGYGTGTADASYGAGQCGEVRYSESYRGSAGQTREVRWEDRMDYRMMSPRGGDGNLRREEGYQRGAGGDRSHYPPLTIKAEPSTTDDGQGGAVLGQGPDWAGLAFNSDLDRAGPAFSAGHGQAGSVFNAGPGLAGPAFDAGLSQAGTALEAGPERAGPAFDAGPGRAGRAFGHLEAVQQAIYRNKPSEQNYACTMPVWQHAETTGDLTNRASSAARVEARPEAKHEARHEAKHEASHEASTHSRHDRSTAAPLHSGLHMCSSAPADLRLLALNTEHSAGGDSTHSNMLQTGITRHGVRSQCGSIHLRVPQEGSAGLDVPQEGFSRPRAPEGDWVASVPLVLDSQQHATSTFTDTPSPSFSSSSTTWGEDFARGPRGDSEPPQTSLTPSDEDKGGEERRLSLADVEDEATLKYVDWLCAQARVPPDAERRAVVNLIVREVSTAHMDTCLYTSDKFTKGLREYEETRRTAREDYESNLDLELMWQHFVNNMSPVIQRVVKFSKKLPGFSDIELDDQMKLIKQSCFEVVLTRYTLLFTDTGLFVPSMTVKIPRDCVRRMPLGSFFEEQYQFSDIFNSLHLSDTETGLITAIVIVSPERQKLVKVQEIRDLQILYLQALYTVMKCSRTDADEAEFESLFRETLKVLPLLNVINEKHAKSLNSLKVGESGESSFPPLHREVFSKDPTSSD